MNRHAASASLLTLILALGLAPARPAPAQELDAYEAPGEASPVFQPPRGEGQRFDPRGEVLGEAPAPAPQAPPAPAPQEERRPEAWGRFGQPREVPRPEPRPDARPDARPEPGRGERDRHDDRREEDPRRRGGYESHGSWGWDRDDRYDRYDPYRYDGYRYGGYRADRHDRHRPPRYDPRGYPPVWIPSYRYRGGPWIPPPGFVPRRWSHGEVLPWTWWTPRYRIESWWRYALPVPPVGFAWVRLGRDAVLVDLWTGRIVQVAYTLFW